LNLSSSSILAKSFKSETKRDPFMSQQSLLILKNPKKETEKKANMVSIIRRQKEREPAKAETEHETEHSSLLLLLLLLLLVLYRLLLAIFRYEAFSQKPTRTSFCTSLFLHTIQGSQTLYNNNNQVLG
jgi:hypothetical protein